MASVTISCDGILCDSQCEVEIPDWLGFTDAGGDGSYLFCPNCEAQSRWFGAVCPGCVEGFHDCKFGRAFEYDDHRRIITENDLKVIEAGVCPFRTNGMFMVNRTSNDVSMETLDLSERADSDSGKAVVDAVRSYIEKYPVKS